MKIIGLKEFAEIYNVEKWGVDYFTKIYEFHFNSIRKNKINLLEIGVGGYNNPEAGGESLRMWKRYFSEANIFGIDLVDKSSLEENRVRIFKGSQNDSLFLDSVIKEMGHLDIIIDDGSQINVDVITTFTYLFPKMKDGGIYVIEDLGTSYWPAYYGGGFHKDTTMNFFKRLTDCLNHKEFLIKNYTPNYFDENIISIHFYRNAVFVYKGKNTHKSTIIDNGEFMFFKK